jgi:cytochrome c peroxidase
MRQTWCLVLVGFILIFILAQSCLFDEESLKLPVDFPKIIVAENNPYSTAKAGLGKRLFFDKNISVDSTVACNNCHLPDYAFSDTIALSNGVNGGITERNSPSLIYSGFSPLINKDGGVVKLDIQALIPIEDQSEMGIHILSLAERLQSDKSYNKAFINAFDREPDAFTIPRALAHFIRSLPSPSSSYDKFIHGDTIALSAMEKNGMHLFMSQRLQCGTCHEPPLFTTFEFANNGLYDTYKDLGRALITQDSKDVGKFRVPSLRNVSLTGPFMHDGSLKSLEDVIQHYASGGSQHINKDVRISSFALSEKEKQELLVFLNTLTDLQPKFKSETPL